MAPDADKYLAVHSVWVKRLHETNVQTSWSFESGKNSDSDLLEMTFLMCKRKIK